MSSKLQRISSIIAITALSTQFGVLEALAQTGEPIANNNGLPMPKPSPTKIVKRMWSAFDLRKGTAPQDTAPIRYTIRSENPADLVNDGTAKIDSPELQTTPGTDKTNNNTANTAEPVTASAETAQAGPGSSPEKDISTPSLRPAISATTSGASISGEAPEAKQIEPPETQTTRITTLEASEPTPVPENQESKLSAENQLSGTAAQDEKSDKSAETALQSDDNSTAGTANPIAVAANIVGLPASSILGGKLQAEFVPDDGTPIIDNDEAVQFKETIKYEELPLADGKTKVKAGARFPIVIVSQITSKTAKVGDPIEARLKFDLKIGDRLIAPKGALVKGHVKYVLKARTIMGSIITLERWYKNSGCLGIAFDELISHKGEHIPLNAVPAREARVIKNKAEGRELGINHDGQIAGPWSTQLRHKAIRVGLNFAMAPAGVFSFGAMPLALGAIGAMNPSFAFSKPVGLNVRHRRLKGFFWGFLSGVPGSWLIEDTTVRGQEAIIKPGDEFYAEFTQEWTGEPASEAELLPGAGTKVRGQVLDDGKKKKGSKK